MKQPRISHIIADVSYRDSLDSLYQLKIFVGDQYEDEVFQPLKAYKELDLSAIDAAFYVKSIDELRSLMKTTSDYNFVVRSYQVYSFYKESPMNVYISSFGGNKITVANLKNFLVHHLLYTEDEELLSHLIETIAGFQNEYDVQSDSFMIADYVHAYERKQRLDDDVIIESVFLTKNNTGLSNKEVITLMRDQNEIPEGMVLRDQFIALEPSQIITLACLLIDNKEAEAA